MENGVTSMYSQIMFNMLTIFLWATVIFIVVSSVFMYFFTRRRNLKENKLLEAYVADRKYQEALSLYAKIKVRYNISSSWWSYGYQRIALGCAYCYLAIGDNYRFNLEIELVKRDNLQKYKLHYLIMAALLHNNLVNAKEYFNMFLSVNPEISMPNETEIYKAIFDYYNGSLNDAKTLFEAFLDMKVGHLIEILVLRILSEIENANFAQNANNTE